ncbi:MAG: methionine--tRNA ligase subunit beta, partial [Chitinophagaceae bacterium]
DYDKQVLDEIAAAPHKIAAHIDIFHFRDAQAEMMNVARLGNKYLADMEPWKVIKTDPGRVKTVLNIALQLCANLSVLLEPFLPTTAGNLRKMLNLQQSTWQQAGNADLIKTGDTIGETSLMFEKIEDATVEAQVQKLLDTKIANETENAQLNPLKPETTFEDFSKLDIRVGVITAAEKVAKAKKLLKLTVDTGIDQRTVVSGIAEHYEPEQIIGQQVLLLANLSPRNLRGVESQGMILMAEDATGKLVFVQPKDAVQTGSQVS